MQKSFSTFLEKFRRITSAGNYIPEIDGLRFVAIFWVVAWMHLPTMLNEHLFNGQLLQNMYAKSVVLEGGQGVPLFFMISGFILSLPFIKQRLQQGKQVSLKQYYLRRLTRLEPPYLVALLIAFLLIVFADGKSFSDYLPHLGASSVYMHNIVYNSSSAVLGVAWSLEVEVQFYVLAPFLCFIFLIKNNAIRRGTLMAGIVLFAVYAWYTLWKQPVILPNFLCYFLCGMLLGDLYESKHRSLMNNTSGLLAGIAVFAGLPFIISLHYPALYMLKIVLLFFAFYMVLFNDKLKQLFSGQLITIIGGMCYSIYLLHTLVMSGTLRWLKTVPGITGIAAVIIYSSLLLIAVLVISALFYKLVEQPCMKKGWWRRAPRNHT
jgi:peptidoglycan/LPS O-acetylase OafA/YrhL